MRPSRRTRAGAAGPFAALVLTALVCTLPWCGAATARELPHGLEAPQEPGLCRAPEASTSPEEREEPVSRLRVFPERCRSHDECVSGTCVLFKEQGGSFCSAPCLTSADCPATSRGCNRKRVCRMPSRS